MTRTQEQEWVRSNCVLITLTGYHWQLSSIVHSDPTDILKFTIYIFCSLSVRTGDLARTWLRVLDTWETWHESRKKINVQLKFHFIILPQGPFSRCFGDFNHNAFNFHKHCHVALKPLNHNRLEILYIQSQSVSPSAGEDYVIQFKPQKGSVNDCCHSQKLFLSFLCTCKFANRVVSLQQGNDSHPMGERVTWI